jgi:phosphate transport system substrate-binding protein
VPISNGSGASRRAVLAGIAAMATLRSSAAGAGTMPLDPALPAWQPGPVAPPTGPYLGQDGRIRIVGTDIMRHLVEGLNQRFAAQYPAFAFELAMNPGLMAIGPAAYGVTAFAPMPRRFTPVENDAFRSIAGRDPVAIRVAHGSVTARDRTAVLAVYVHRSNPIAHLSVDQLGGIFTAGWPSGEITKWGQLGLADQWANRPIHPVGTPEDVGFGSYLVQEKFDGWPLTPSITLRPISTEVMKIVAGDVGAIAYAAINFATAETRQVAIGAGPKGPWLSGTAAEVMSDAYALDRFVYLYALPDRRGALEPWVREYFRLALSRDGQLIVAAEQGSFLPLSAGCALAELRRVNA